MPGKPPRRAPRQGRHPDRTDNPIRYRIWSRGYPPSVWAGNNRSRLCLGAALRWRGGVADVIHRFVGSIGAHVQEMIRGDRIADPSEFGPVELHLRLLGKLLEI